MISSPVLVLNQNYEPLNICTVRRAVVLLGVGKAETLENAEGEISTASYAIPIPSVIRLMYLIRRPVLQRRLSRREIFLRDKFTCLYCGRETKQLTLDHVVPRYRGGAHTWENVVSACITCNHRKGRAHATGSRDAPRGGAAPPSFESLLPLSAQTHSGGMGQVRSLAGQVGGEPLHRHLSPLTSRFACASLVSEH